MNLDRATVYSLLGLRDPEVFKEEVRVEYVKLLFSEFRKVLNNENYLTPYVSYCNRQNGKTTNKIIEAIIAEYAGKEVVMLTHSSMEERRVHNLYSYYRAELTGHYGDPQHLYGGRVKIISKERDKFYLRGKSNVLFIDDTYYAYN